MDEFDDFDDFIPDDDYWYLPEDSAVETWESPVSDAEIWGEVYMSQFD